MPRITFAQTTFAIEGIFSSRSFHLKLRQAIERRGGIYSYVVDKSVQVLIVGAGAEYKIAAARARGAYILDEAQASALLKDGFVEVELPQLSPELDLNETIAELRGLFDGPPTSQAWTRCLELVELCDPARQPQLVPYIQSFITRWDAHAARPWQPDPEHILLSHCAESWPKAILLDDELRQAPPSWLFELCHGKQEAKHELVRALNFTGMGVNLAISKKIFANPYLTHVTSLNFADSPACHGLKFYQALRTAEIMRTVQTLTLYSLSSGFDQGIQNLCGDEHTFDSLRTLRIFTDGYHNPDYLLGTLSTFPALQHVTIHVKPLYRALALASASQAAS